MNILKYENLNKTLKFTFSFKLNKYERLCYISKLKYFENLNESEIFMNIVKFLFFISN